ncbi:Nucleolar protein 12 [Venturia inaequalis]|nr:Nucleolar protein 12 [Venturia inaequalis]
MQFSQTLLLTIASFGIMAFAAPIEQAQSAPAVEAVADNFDPCIKGLPGSDLCEKALRAASSGGGSVSVGYGYDAKKGTANVSGSVRGY